MDGAPRDSRPSPHPGRHIRPSNMLLPHRSDISQLVRARAETVCMHVLCCLAELLARLHVQSSAHRFSERCKWYQALQSRWWSASKLRRTRSVCVSEANKFRNQGSKGLLHHNTKKQGSQHATQTVHTYDLAALFRRGLCP